MRTSSKLTVGSASLLAAATHAASSRASRASGVSMVTVRCWRSRGWSGRGPIGAQDAVLIDDLDLFVHGTSSSADASRDTAGGRAVPARDESENWLRSPS